VCLNGPLWDTVQVKRPRDFRAARPTTGNVPGLGASTHAEAARDGAEVQHHDDGSATLSAEEVQALDDVEQAATRQPPSVRWARGRAARAAEASWADIGRPTGLSGRAATERWFTGG
jgi:hypothetical protein